MISISNTLQSALKCQREGRLSEAASLCANVLAVQADNSDALYLLGVIAFHMKNLTLAMESFEKCRTAQAKNAGYQHNFGLVLLSCNRPSDAADCFRQAIILQPDHAAAYNDLGRAYYELRSFEDAVTAYRAAISLVPGFARAHGNLGNALLALGQIEQAVESSRRAVDLEPEFAVAHNNLGNALRHAGDPSAAIVHLERAIHLQPDFAEAHNNLGVAWHETGNWQRAEESCRRAIVLKPAYGSAYYNLANSLQAQGRIREANASYDEALKIQPASSAFNFNSAINCLLLGDYENGLPRFEYRWSVPNYSLNRENFLKPLWLGNTSLEGKSILLHAEQGFGDTFQMVRYISIVRKLGARVILQVPPALKSILSRLPDLHGLYTTGETLPPHDFHCPLMSLPLASHTTSENIPCPSSYLDARVDLQEKIAHELRDYNGLRIGLCWKGAALYANDVRRSPGITPFKRLLDIQGTHYFSLMTNCRNEFLAAGPNTVDLGRDLDQETSPFEETAALIMNLDLVITCDTSIGHLAGALGKPVWLVLAHVPDWRWMMDREDSPWYRSARLFRQRQPGDWPDVFRRVKLRLLDVMEGRSPLLWEI